MRQPPLRRPRLRPPLRRPQLRLPPLRQPPQELQAISSIRRGASLLVACVLGAWALGGCVPPAPAPNAWRYSRTGHVYIARLLSEHPLYPQYQRLAQEIASLQKPCMLPTLSLIHI